MANWDILGDPVGEEASLTYDGTAATFTLSVDQNGVGQDIVSSAVSDASNWHIYTVEVSTSAVTYRQDGTQISTHSPSSFPAFSWTLPMDTGNKFTDLVAQSGASVSTSDQNTAGSTLGTRYGITWNTIV